MKFANLLLSNLVDKPQVEHIFMLNAQGGYGPVVKDEDFGRMDRHDYYASDTSYDSDNSTQNAAIVRASDFDYDYVPPEIKIPDIMLVCTTCGEQSTEQCCALQCRSAKCQAKGRGAGIHFLWRRPGDPEFTQEELGYPTEQAREDAQDETENVKQEQAQDCKVHVQADTMPLTATKAKKSQAKETRKKAPPFNMTLRPRQACRPPVVLGSPVVAHIGRARKRGEYHHQSCSVITAQEAAWQSNPKVPMVYYVSAQFVNTYVMRQARCCNDKL
jgi:hypothetical protein